MRCRKSCESKFSARIAKYACRAYKKTKQSEASIYITVYTHNVRNALHSHMLQITTK
jgi:hypothetical protein